jgi:hypothetical protein
VSRGGRGWALLACALLLLLLVPGPAGAQAARPLHLGFLDGAFSGPDATQWLGRSAAAGADLVRIDIGWVAPGGTRRPPGFDARDPADPAYDFSRADAAIRAADEQGLQVIAAFTGAPGWAEGPGRPSDAPPGSWRPDPRALEDYGAALARRYSGSYPDPAAPGRTLPRVAAFQVWNEPNLSKYLTPQWSHGRTAAPAIYRAMLNGFYRGVKSVDPSAVVVTAGTAPFGDPFAGGERIMPARFVRDLLCLREVAGRLRGTTCPDPAHFDVLSHHPYSVGSPAGRALNADDVSIPDLGKLTRLLRAAERSGRALPRIRHRMWVTEVSYDSSPPDPQGVPLQQHAHYLEQTLHELWLQGVDTVVWFQVGDQLPDPSYAATNQSGVYYADGRPKPALEAFRFPFVADASGASRARVWGRAPAAGTIAIERAVAGGWRTLATLQAAAHAVFLARVKAPAGSVLRARLAQEASLTWRVG